MRFMKTSGCRGSGNPLNPVVYCSVNGAREATAPAVTMSSTVLAQNTIDTDTAPGGHVTKVWVLY